MFFSNEDNLSLIEKLKSHGVNTSFKENKVNFNSYFYNKNIVITGSFNNYKRDDLKDELMLMGANIKQSVSSKTDILLIGENPGTKLEKAIENKVEIMNEKELQGKL